MKFDQLIKYEMKNIFLENSYAKCGGETSTRFFYKKSNFSISMNSLKCDKVCFYYMAK